MGRYALACTNCGRKAGYLDFRCRECGHILEVRLDYSKIRLPRDFRKQKPGHFKYIKLFPIDKFEIRSSEGGTPLARKRFNGSEVMLKLETENPTRSFKDRGSVVEINRALELGVKEVCCASTGNMGISVAHYSMLAGIKCTIFVSSDANARKMALIRKNKARLVRVRGDFNKALKAAEAFARKTGAFVCGDYHYRKEGQKSVIFEILDQLKFNAPDYIFVPVGNATLLAAMYKGLQEYRRFGFIKKFPRIVAVQSEMCDPLVRAYNSGKHIEYMKPRTVADAIAVGFPTFGFEGLRALKNTDGLGIAVTEKEIEDAIISLSEMKVYAEPGGAAGFAGYKKFCSDNRLKDQRIVVVITGNNER